MSALTKPRDTQEIFGSCVELTVATGAELFSGALVAVNGDGFAVPASDTAGLKVLGRCENSASAGEKILAKKGCYLYDNSADDEVTTANIGDVCYVVDDQTVQATANTNAVIAGIVRNVKPEGVYVDTACGIVTITIE